MILTLFGIDWKTTGLCKLTLKIAVHHMASIVVNYMSTVENNSNSENDEENDEFS